MMNKDIQEPQTTEVQDIRTKRLLITDQCESERRAHFEAE